MGELDVVDAEKPQISLVGNRFRIEREVGAGGMGTVYRALDLETSAVVAVKTLQAVKTAGALERFARESRLLSELEHPNVVRWIAHGTTDDGVPYLAMEWLDGEDLATRLTRGPLTPAESIALATRVASALAAAHERGIVHRDVKPANIHLTGGRIEDVRVLDFGIARSAQDAWRTRTGMVLGTVGYMAPEQLRGERDLDARADVFSLGCVLYECLTGRPAFTGEHVMAIATKILMEDAPRVSEVLPDVPPATDDLVARMLERDRAKRISSAAAAITALRLADIETVSSRRVSLGSNEQRVVSVIIAATALADPEKAAEQATVTPDDHGPLRAVLAAAVEPFGASLEMPGNSTVVVLLSGDGTPAEQALRAARCALAVRPLLADAPMALVTGLCVVRGRLPLGTLVDRAFSELRTAPRSGVGVDELTGALVMDKFEIEKTPRGLVLREARETTDPRTLLGKQTPYVGRDRELAALHGVLDECASEGLARAVLVTAPPGVGKSRLIRELLRTIPSRARPARMLFAQGDSISPGTPLGLIARALRGAAGASPSDPIAAKRECVSALFRARVRSDDEAALLPFFGELAGVPWPDEGNAALRIARADPLVMNDGLQRAFIRWLEAECDAGPVLLVLEDLHWGDATSVRYVDHTLDVLAERPFMVLASARPEVATTFPALWKTRALTELSLAGLSKKAAERLVHAVLGESFPPDAAKRLVERAAGNAFFLEELVRYAAEGRSGALPESMIGMMNLRLADLDAETRRLLRAASVVGETFWSGAVAHLTGERPSQVKTRIDALVARELLSRSPHTGFPGEDELVFRHALVREVAYATLTDEDKRLGHKLAGEWLERAGAQDPSALARHFQRGGEPARAAAWFDRAAIEALEVNDLDGALERAANGVACEPAPTVTASLRLTAGRAYRWKGELAKARPDLTAAFELLPRGTDRWFEAGAELTSVVARLGDEDAAVQVGAGLLAAPRALDASPAVRTVALARATHLLSFPDHSPIAKDLLRGAQDEARTSNVADGSALAQLRSAEWAYAMSQGSCAEALLASREASRLFEAIGDHRTLVVERFGELASMCELGLFAEAVDVAERSIALGEKIGLPFSVALIRMTLGTALMERDELARAKPVFESSANWLSGRTPIEWWPRVGLALCAARAGDLDDALRHAARAIECVKIRACIGSAHGCMASIRLLRGENDEALARAKEGLARVDALAGVPPLDSFVRSTFVRVHDALGYRDAALAEARSASRLIRERAARIDNPAWRAAYVGHPDRRFLLEFAG
jgi:tetratricopeptide (TPR) repeat protein